MKVFTIFNAKKRDLFFSIFVAFLIFFAVIFIFFGKVAIDASVEAMVVFGATVMPVIIPFSTLILLLNYGTDKIDKTKNSFIYNALKYIFIITAGYPTGAKTATLLHFNGAKQNSCKRLLFMTSIASPLVVINCVGKLTFNSTTFGVIMFLCEVLSAKIIVDVTLNDGASDIDFSYPKNRLSSALSENVIAILVSATLTLFCYSVAKINVDLFFIDAKDYPLLFGTITGVFETNFGMKWFSMIISPLSIALANFILTFGGAPIIFQTIIYAKQLKMRTAEVIKIKLLQSAICFLLTYLIMLIFFLLTL